jgi:enduracididine beta-hydroxylase
MNKIVLIDIERQETELLLDEVGSRYNSVEDPEFLRDSTLIAHELPIRVRKFLNDFRYSEDESGFCVVSGYQIDSLRLPRTPQHWKNREKPSPVFREEVLLVVLSALLGDPIGWSTQQDGYMVHDVLPIQGHEDEQLGTGSEQLLCWHTEDAFHPSRGDYIALMCLRNPDGVATTVGSIGNAKLDRADIDTLFEPHFVIWPDNSHLEKHQSGECKEAKAADNNLKSAYERINKMNTNPEKVSVLLGHPDSPYIRLDPYFMGPADSEAAQAAYDRLVKVVDQNTIEYVAEPGDVLFIDNFRAVHGRKPFFARYDGSDRWLKRVNIARDLRKSRSLRIGCDSRVIY